MSNRSRTLTIVLLLFSIFITTSSFASRRVKTFGEKAPKSNGSMSKISSKDKLKPFEKLIKDHVKIEGLFTFYQDTIKNSYLMEIKPEHFGPLYLCNQTRSQAEGAFFDNGSMGRSFPFYIKRIGKKIMLMEKNLRYRADTLSTLHKAVERGISDHLFASTSVLSKPQDSTNSILINPSSIFLKDIENISYFLGKASRTGVGFDSKNSYFKKVQSFPENSEIDVKLHFKTSKPLYASSMQNPYSMFHTFHYSLSTLPKSDFVPRVADDRVGYFQTIYQDYSKLNKDTDYVRYVNRWDLKKKNPEARISEPVKPIVYWVENTVPEEYRDAVAEGIEFWNGAFEEIGFRNAVVAKQMPDTAEWDPADVRYSTVRWIINPGGTYAVGPSRANPFTGQIYDADIRVCVDFIKYMFLTMDRFIEPVSESGMPALQEEFKLPKDFFNEYQFCNYGSESAKEAAFGMSYLYANAGDFTDVDSLTKEYVYSYIVELVAHEVGHTLGLRHNFKASTIYSLEEINDRSFTTKNGTLGTVMDYAPPNIAGPGKVQGEFYSSVPGPYDKWVIEYAYSDFGDITAEEETAKLQSIANRSGDPNLIYGTDNDAFGSSTISVDPKCNLFDMGDDPIKYCEHKIKLTKHLWANTLEKFEKPGERYQKLLKVFQSGWRSYTESARFASKYISGLYSHKNHIGEENGKIPFEPVPAAEQRRAMAFLSDNIFAADAFEFPAELLNRLLPDRRPSYSGSEYSRVDYPIHSRVLRVQRTALYMLYSPYILERLLNNQLRLENDADKYTMVNLFDDTRRSIWTEIVSTGNVNSFRRQLQLAHLNLIVSIFLGSSAIYPFDARALASNDLDVIESAIKKIQNSPASDSMTKAHYKEVVRQIAAARGAKREFIGARF